MDCGELNYIKADGLEKTSALLIIILFSFVFGGINTSIIFKRWSSDLNR
jgi:hypothetical protein